jgi:hypothetical protein
VDQLKRQGGSSRCAVGQRLDEVRPAKRVDGVRDPGLVRDDLLGAQRDPDGLLGRQGERLVVGVRVQRLGAAEHPREKKLRRGAKSSTSSPRSTACST